MTYRLVFSFVAAINRAGSEVPVAEQTWHADTLNGVARLARDWSNQFTLHDFASADIYAAGDHFALNPEPLMSADDVAAFVADWEGLAA